MTADLQDASCAWRELIWFVYIWPWPSTSLRERHPLRQISTPPGLQVPMHRLREGTVRPPAGWRRIHDGGLFLLYYVIATCMSCVEANCASKVLLQCYTSCSSFGFLCNINGDEASDHFIIFYPDNYHVVCHEVSIRSSLFLRHKMLNCYSIYLGLARLTSYVFSVLLYKT
jgi:hypothetical protein